MANGSESYDESGVRRRRSVEQDASSRNGNEESNAGTSIRTLNADGEPIIQTTATDLPSPSRPTYAGDLERVRFSGESEGRPVVKKRKSDEISRDAHTTTHPSTTTAAKDGARYPLSVDTRIANQTLPRNAASPTHTSPPANTSPAPSSPLSARSRNRGMSLRTSLFTRNVDLRRSPTSPSSIEMQTVETLGDKAAGRPQTAKSEIRTSSVIVRPVMERSESDDALETAAPPKHGAVRLKSPEHQSRAPSSRKGFQGIAALPHYQRWLAERAKRHLPIKRCKDAYERAHNMLLRIQEIPPSKDGRHVPLDPARKKALVDERTGHPYVSNFIKSSKYTPWNFLPRQLFAQFSKLANLYFLIVATLQMIPGLSTTGTYTTIIPLMFFVSISMAKEGYEDVRRHRLDKAENNRTANVLHAYRPVVPSDEEAGNQHETEQAGPLHWAAVKWQSLRVGDIVKLERDEAVPADVLLLDSKGENSIAYIETMALDGETNLKTKQPSGALVGRCSTPEAIASLDNVEVVVEDPNLDLYNFEGRVNMKGELAPLTINEILYRGSILRNTSEVTGVIVYSGEECKIRKNANRNPRVKAPSLQWTVNRIVICIVIFVVFLALLNTILYQVWHFQVEVKSWYLTHAHVAFAPIIISFIIMFNTMIPLSLYISMEIIKVAQIYLMNDIDMFDAASNTPFEARTSTINEELGQVSYIFSDKTGTLTENIMQFRKLSVAGHAALHDADLRDQPQEELLMHKKRKAKGKRPMYKGLRKSGVENTAAQPQSPSRKNSQMEAVASPRKSTATWRSGVRGVAQPELSTADLIRYIQRAPQTAFARKMRMMLLAMALCHTCLPEHGSEEDDVSYQASSPDERALVQAARELGFFVFDRDVYTLTVKTYPNGLDAEPVLERYEVLDVIEFSSKRKRMSVVVRLPDDRVCLICKGADSVITERLRLATLANQKIAEIEKRVDERRSLEAQEAIRRKTSTAERQSSVGSLPRPSLSRPSMAMARASIGRLPPVRDEVDGWLREREQDVTLPAERSHYTPRPSAQILRQSVALSEYSVQSDLDTLSPIEESLVLDDAAVIERCFQHVNDFATEGLRTLLYGHRFLTEADYRAWKKVYQDATTSLTDRQQMVEAAGELIEQNLELTGATAIEDKLQTGVPETIERLRRANIKLWMLTGDKRETAINIGHSCRLIKDYSTLTILDHEAGKVEQNIAAAIVNTTNAGNPVAHAVVIVDGNTLAMIQTDASLHTLFLDLAILADSVICCRASPSQKAHLVHAIRRRVNRSVTLAIGDGANDIAMIQEAHVGIGITGREGLQAARSADYSIAQFRFLNKLLLVHGRWNYVRVCKYILATFWKEMLFYLTQALYQHWNGYTGTSLYEQWSLSQFNTLFTSLPVIFLGAFEKDLAASTLIAVPELYSKGQRSAGFNFRVYLSWMFMAASEALIIFFTMKGLWGESLPSRQDLFSMGDLTFSACIIVINCKIQLLEQRNRTVIAAICVVVEIGGWFLWNIIFSCMYGDNAVYDVKGGFLERFGANVLWWVTLVIAVAACLLWEITVRAVKNALLPTDVEVFQCLERDLSVRRRFEEASASELQAGWKHGSQKSSGELRREEAEEEEREGQVRDLLERPRVMEDVVGGGGGDGGENKKSGVVVVEEGVRRRSSDIQEMLSRRFGSVRGGMLV